jgi:hypothetical protein
MRSFKLIVAGIILLLLAVGSFFVFGNYSDGYRAGRVMKVTNKGYIFKTYEGQLNTGGVENNGPDGGSSNVWNFSITDEKVIEDINAAVDNGYSVKLYYHEKYYTFWFWGDTKYFVYKVEQVKSPSAPAL